MCGKFHHETYSLPTYTLFMIIQKQWSLGKQLFSMSAHTRVLHTDTDVYNQLVTKCQTKPAYNLNQTFFNDSLKPFTGLRRNS